MTHLILLQASGSGSSGMAYQLIMMVGIIAVFYFFMIRPQQRKQREQKNMLNGLKEGDSVVTIGGLHGKVHSLDETTITLTMDKGVKLTFDKSSVAKKV